MVLMTWGLDLHLDLPAGTGRRAALEDALRTAVREGRLPPHSRLPSTRALAVELSMSRGTVSAAYDQLVAEGYLMARHGSGTVVAPLVSGSSSARNREGSGRPGGVAARRPPGVARVPDPGRPGAGPRPGPPRFDLRPGRPDVSSFPVATWLHATRKALTAAPLAAYDYGDPQGAIELRTALAGYLGRTRGVVCGPDRIVVTSGAVQALSLLAGVLGRGGGVRFAMEDPGLTFHREVVRRQGIEVVPLPVGAEGARTDLLATAGTPPVSAVVLTPAHQYPCGVALAPALRLAAIEWAGTTGGLVVEDDYDGEFRYDRQSVGALQGTSPENVVYLGTASKTLGPGLRLGWMVLPERWVEPLAEAKRCADLQTETIGQLTLAEMINSHDFDRHVRSCRQRYRSRRNLLVERLGQAADGGYRLGGIAAGLHCCIDLLDGGPGEEEVLSVAAAHGLALGQMGTHWHDPEGRSQGLVVGFGTPSESAFPAALDALIRSLRGAPRRR